MHLIVLEGSEEQSTGENYHHNLVFYAMSSCQNSLKFKVESNRDAYDVLEAGITYLGSKLAELFSTIKDFEKSICKA